MKMSLKPPALVVVMALTGRVGQSCASRLRGGGEAQRGRKQQRWDFHECPSDVSVAGADHCGCRLAFLAMRSTWARDCSRYWANSAGVSEHRIERALDEILLRERRIVADRRHVVANFPDDRRRRALRRPEAEIGLGQIGVGTQLLQGRNVREQRRALAGIDRDTVDGAGLQMRDEVADAEERDRRRSGQHAVDRLAAAAKRHAHDVGAGFLLEALNEELVRDGSRRIGQRLRMRLGISGKLLQRVDVERRRHHEALRRKNSTVTGSRSLNRS